MTARCQHRLDEYICSCPGGGGWWSRDRHLHGCLFSNAYAGIIPWLLVEPVSSTSESLAPPGAGSCESDSAP